MQGTINSIWFTNNGKLHPKVVPNLAALVQEAVVNHFQVVLWTNLEQVSEVDIKALADKNITVKDYRECYSSQFYSHFINFFKKGMKGDKAAFGLASDIFRMCVLDLSPSNQYYIYFDPNDVTFPNFGKSLAQLYLLMSANSFGFSFYIMPLFGDMQVFHIRNDVLIAKKEVNPQFFEDYLAAYATHLELTAKTYFEPQTDAEAQRLAGEISLQTGNRFFQIFLTKPMRTVKATFGPYAASLDFVNCFRLFPYHRHIEDANNWLPNGLCLEEQAELISHFSMGPAYPTSYTDNPQRFFAQEVPERLVSLIEDSVPIARVTRLPSSFPEQMLDYLRRMLMPPPKRRLTYPAWENVKNPSPQRSLPFPMKFFTQIYKDYITEHRHDNPKLQEEYDQQYGLIVRK